jgi:hypothetical protein
MNDIKKDCQCRTEFLRGKITCDTCNEIDNKQRAEAVRKDIEKIEKYLEKDKSNLIRAIANLLYYSNISVRFMIDDE